MIEDAGNLYIRFDAIPNAEEIELISNLAVNTNDLNASISNCKIFPNPSDGFTTLSFDLKESGDLSISIVDVSGRLIKEFEKKTYPNGKHKISIDTNEWNPQLVYCVISLDGIVLMKKALTKF